MIYSGWRWLQEYGIQWGEDSLFTRWQRAGRDQPGRTGPRARRYSTNWRMLETAIKRALDDLHGLRFVSANAIPELNARFANVSARKT